ncbi:aldehyde dehydrogenase domain-containing protein [Aspergillus caelatus]|uniref:aldehyde dehydrogenase (NAD(+)) n=1 Tax=Aspergillus caelatus TaxID=61420 RepID=A0A5N7A3R4_9EURO|nr:aldehyde dehydrogenase domain-containing protein [Aspergillus caelatus]KAE8364494.1 aldehyde dehydrogenase domain-containing protein [Aspergillus caelatus]
MTFNVFEDFRNSIGGKQTTTSENRHGINPATSEPNPNVPVSTQEDVNRAVAAAEEAFKIWANTPFAERQRAVLAFADAIEKYASDFAKLLVQEQGKPMHVATLETNTSTQMLRQMAKIAADMKVEVVEDSTERRIIVRHTPIGVAVGIVPWNFPLSLACQKIAPAVLTGNTIIIKPSPFTPYTGLKLVELAQSVFPPGVVQALSGDDNLGPWLTTHPGIGKISFTGSSATGKKVMESASKTLKRVTLELGGKDAAIICSDVDIETTAAKVASLSFLNSGQICVAIKRVYVHESIFEKFRDAIIAFTKTLKVGEGDKEDTFMGPIQNSMQFEKVKQFLSDLTSEQIALSNGTNQPFDSSKPGFFINPTIVDRPADHSRIAIEEPFGPILPLMSWREENDVVARANKTRMGLGASVWSDNEKQAERIASKLQAGSVWVNTHLELDARAPFGGHKESGLGSELGMAGLEAYTNLQTLHLKKKP